MKKLLAGLLLATTSTAYGTNYEITILEGLDPGGTSLAYGMNESGQVVGQAYNETTGVNEAVIWDNGVVVSLGFEGIARAVNNDGLVVGETGTGNLFWPTGEAFSWQSGVYSDLGGGAQSGAYDVNDAGTITGFAFFDAALTTGAHGFRYEGGVMTDIGTYSNPDGYSRGHGINDSGTIAGRASEDLFSGSDKHMSTWDSTNTIDYQPTTYDYSTAQQINNNGIVVGNGSNASGVGGEAIVWNTDGSVVYLGTLGGTSSRAYSINDDDIIAGTAMIEGDIQHAMISEDGQTIVDLNDLVIDMTGWETLNIAYDISENGDIVGVGTLSDGTQQAFLLTAVPVPAAAWLFGSALGLLGWLRRKRSNQMLN